jgi:hypothetical protein
MSSAFIRSYVSPYGPKKLKKGQDNLVFTVKVLHVFYFVEEAVHGAVRDFPVNGEKDGLETFKRMFSQPDVFFSRFRGILLEEMIQSIFHLRSEIVFVSLLCQANTS